MSEDELSLEDLTITMGGTCPSCKKEVSGEIIFKGDDCTWTCSDCQYVLNIGDSNSKEQR